MSLVDQRRKVLVALSHELGAEHRELAILGEGNTSTKVGEGRFLVTTELGGHGPSISHHPECMYTLALLHSQPWSVAPRRDSYDSLHQSQVLELLHSLLIVYSNTLKVVRKVKI